MGLKIVRRLRVGAICALLGFAAWWGMGQLHVAAASGELAVVTTPRGDGEPAWLIIRNGSDPALLRRQLPVPAQALQDVALAPDGRHLAYYSGAVSRPGEPVVADLTLHILRVADGAIVRAIPLVAPDFPANIDVTAGLLRQRDAEFATVVDLEEAVWVVYIDGLRRLAWSPDGAHLAFGGSMDGPTSDLYRYTPARDELVRLSDGIEQIDRLRWSPDGRWIWHSTVSLGYCQACAGHQYAAAADGSAMIDLPGDDIHRFLGWLDETLFLETNQANGPGDYDLRTVRVDTGETTTLWPGTHERFALDWAAQRLALVGTPGRQWDPNVRLYVVDLQSGATTEAPADSLSVDDPDPLVAALAGPFSACRAQPIRRPCDDSASGARTADGSQVVAGDGSVTTAGGQMLLPAHPVLAGGAIFWRADGSGYYVLKARTLFYRDGATGHVKQLARHVQQVQWLAPQGAQ